MSDQEKEPGGGGGTTRRPSGGKAKPGARHKFANRSPGEEPQYRSPKEIAEEFMSERTTLDLALNARALAGAASNPRLNALQAILLIVQARLKGEMWNSYGSEEIADIISDESQTHVLVLVPLKTLLYVAIAYAELREGAVPSLDAAFGISNPTGGDSRPFSVQREEGIKQIMRAIEVAHYITKGLSEHEAISKLADQTKLDVSTIRKNFRKYKPELAKRIPAVAALPPTLRRQRGRKTAPSD